MDTYDLTALSQISDNVANELRDAEVGRKTSFAFIIHELPDAPIVKPDEVIQVLVFGGSIHLNALLKMKHDGTFQLLKRESKSQHRYDTAEEFLAVVDEDIDPSVRVIAMNLAYPMTPVFENGRLDGALIQGTKENTFAGLEGKKIGKAIEERVKKKTGRTVIVSIANDTACLLLSGLTEVSQHREIAAGIVGTGLNFAIFLNKNHLVNLEAANFDKFPQSTEGRLLDAASAKPGQARLEKEVSGAYLHEHFNIILNREGIAFPPLTSTYEMNQLLENPESEVTPIARALFTRSAGFASTIIAGITKYKQKDMDFVMEGSVFWNASGYRRMVKENLLKLAPEYNIKFIKIEDSPIFGAAKLVS